MYYNEDKTFILLINKEIMIDNNKKIIDVILELDSLKLKFVCMIYNI